MKRMRFLILLALMFVGACSGLNPAAPPAPPAEVPAALRFPGDVGIDISKVDDSASDAAAITVGTPANTQKERFTQSYRAVRLILNSVLGPLSEIEIPIGLDVRTFETVFFDDKGVIRNLKISFDDFDFNQDGLNEGCSGHTAALPICYRIWVNDSPKLAGLFETYPLPENPGKGRFKGSLLSDKEGVLGAIYDHRDSENILTELFAGERVNALTGELFDVGHVVATQVGPPATAVKTLNIAFLNQSDLENQVGRFREDRELLSLSLESSKEPDNNFTAACIDLSDTLFVEEAVCEDSGINVRDIDFTDPPTIDDVLLPPDAVLPPPF